MTISLATLLVKETKDKIYETALGIAESIGLNTTTWRAGDPTRSLYHLESELLSTLEDVVVGFISSGFLDHASGVWLEILADQVFGVTVPDATFATTDVVLTNSGGGVYSIDPGDLTFKNTVTGKTYRNTTGGLLASGPGTELTLTVVADEAGAESSAAAGEIDDLVTSLLGVTVTNPLAAVGIDKQDEATTRQQCRDKLGALSPNGPKDAYAYVARNKDLTGTTEVTRVRVYSDSTTGEVTVYLASPSGAVSEPSRVAVEDAILKWATPLCITPTVLSAAAVPVSVSYELWTYASVNKSVEAIEEDVEAALENLFATRPIGGDIVPPAVSGALYKSLIQSTIREVYPQVFRVEVSTPLGDIPLGNGEVAALSGVSAVINIVGDP
jgi:hypothetical protein